MADIPAPKWSKYIPHQPTAKQLAFLLLPHLEAFYGGAAGGGKSDALLMGALQYADVPGYSAIIFRKTLTELKGAEGLISRSHEWLSGTDAKWVAGEHSWYFPTRNPDGTPGFPSRLEFGYVGDMGTKEKYQGRAYQYCGFDELTHHLEEDYLYLFSRLRKTVCPIHRTVNGVPHYVDDCPHCIVRKSVPLRMRSTSNPGGTGHRWVKNRFRIEPHMDPLEAKKQGIRVRYIGKHPTRPFIPSSVEDNPFLDQQGYIQGLEQLGKVTMNQLRYGDWGISPDSRFKPEWMRYYSHRGSYFTLGEDGHGDVRTLNTMLKIFGVVDSAASTRQGPGDTDRYPGQAPNWTVFGVFAVTYDYHLLWLDFMRFRKEIPDVVHHLKKLHAFWRNLGLSYWVIEQNGLGKGVCQYAIREGLPVKTNHRSTDKIINSTEAQIRMERGRIWLPQVAPWRQVIEDELFTWTGHPTDEEDDIVDVLSDAAREVSWESASDEVAEDPLVVNDVVPGVVDYVGYQGPEPWSVSFRPY